MFSGVGDPDALVIAEFMRQTPPRLPDDLTTAQVDAWLELAELVSDTEFERTMRKMVLSGGSDYRIDFGLRIRPLVLEHAGQAVEQGMHPNPIPAVRFSTASCLPTSVRPIPRHYSNGWIWSPKRESNGTGNC
ncbi:hypothetical protein ACFYXQ_24675 [Nocardia jiangxiensis]|uniref:Uncharacterized protein n=1 Tax=Nocardia jiangxiensis TaxID=282685 RepID=A0ABW6S3W2_9NOCA